MAKGCSAKGLHGATVAMLVCAFMTWAVSLGGVGSLQYMCQEPLANTGYLIGVRGFSAAQVGCYSLFAYYWMQVALQFVILCGIALAVAGNAVACMRPALVGLLAVITTLYIQAGDSFITATYVTHYQDGLEMHTARATAAGFIMTAVFNLALLACIGSGAEAGACATGAGNKQQQGGPQVEVHV